MLAENSHVWYAANNPPKPSDNLQFIDQPKISLTGEITMENKIKNVVTFIFEQGIEITRDVLEEKLLEAYQRGRNDGLQEQIDVTANNIRYNTMLKIRQRKQFLYENNFYKKSDESTIVEMKALEYLEKHISEFITNNIEH